MNQSTSLFQTKAKMTAVVLAFFFSGYFGFNHFRLENQEKPENKTIYRLSPDEIAKLRNGDIIMRKGEGFVSGIINDLFNTGYNLSHCGIVLTENDSVKIIHTVSSELSKIDGVQTESLNKFVRESVLNTIVVVRYKASEETGNQIASACKVYLTPERHKAFDHRFDLADTTKFYCTELIHYAYLDVFNQDMFTERLQSDHPNFLGLDAFLDTTRFEIILNHQQDNKQSISLK
jgi:hypothetical protein